MNNQNQGCTCNTVANGNVQAASCCAPRNTETCSCGGGCCGGSCTPGYC